MLHSEGKSVRNKKRFLVYNTFKYTDKIQWVWACELAHWIKVLAASLTAWDRLLRSTLPEEWSKQKNSLKILLTVEKHIFYIFIRCHAWGWNTYALRLIKLSWLPHQWPCILLLGIKVFKIHSSNNMEVQ